MKNKLHAGQRDMKQIYSLGHKKMRTAKAVCLKCCIPSKDHTREPVRACFSFTRNQDWTINEDDHKWCASAHSH